MQDSNIRQLVCRLYPFSLKRTTIYKFEVSKECPGIGLGEPMGQEKFERMLEMALKANATRNRACKVED